MYVYYYFEEKNAYLKFSIFQAKWSYTPVSKPYIYIKKGNGNFVSKLRDERLAMFLMIMESLVLM